MAQTTYRKTGTKGKTEMLTAMLLVAVFMGFAAIVIFV